ncbi:hypothetical protein J6590_020553 [Homalodisca vitripennis]|nr:hypothetical protein J6590_020553 [Homalodisca vitripennis]
MDLNKAISCCKRRERQQLSAEANTYTSCQCASMRAYTAVMEVANLHCEKCVHL